MALIQKSKQSRGRHFLRQWRETSEKTQAQVADFIGVEQSTVSKMERGLLPYNQDFLERLASLYGCEPYDLLMTDPTAAPDEPRRIYDNLKKATPIVQERALAILDAVLKTG